MKFAVGIIVQLIILMSVFDIYFRTPIVPVETIHSLPEPAPSFRVVFVVIDGLRASTFFSNYTESKAINGSLVPKLKEIIEMNGSLGVSRTRVPTETRPGHVAMFAGFYEDPSAITKGWTENPIDFDSVFNRSRITYAWGSPDVLHIFSKNNNKMTAFTYDHDLENFYSGLTYITDKWVFDHVYEFLVSAKLNRTLFNSLQEEKLIIFLHLLGTDTAGHVHKPGSKMYFKNIRYVDQELQKVVDKFDSFYNYDGRTTYIVTSDHGMTNWGSHGAGSIDETEVPFLIWGAGIAYGCQEEALWQADIAPLISTLLGIPFPVNSIGVLPTSYLRLNDCIIANAYITNLKQLIELYKMKEKSVDRSLLSILGVPGRKFPVEFTDEVMMRLYNNIKKGLCDKVIRKTGDYIKLVLQGIDFYDTFYQRTLLVYMTVIIIFWCLRLFQSSIIQFWPDYDIHDIYLAPQLRTSLFRRVLHITIKICKFIYKHKIVLILILLKSIFVYVLEFPITFFIYFNMPFCLFALMGSYFHVFINALRRLEIHEIQLRTFGLILLYIFLASMMVLSFYYRSALSVVLMILLRWRVVTANMSITEFKIILMWCVTGAILGFFPLFPVIGSNKNIFLVFLGGFAWIFYAVTVRREFPDIVLGKISPKSFKFINSLQILFIILTMFLTLECRLILFNFDQMMWRTVAIIISVLQFFLVFWTPCTILPRIHGLTLGVVPALMLMSGTYELLFLLIFSVHIMLWIMVENLTHPVKGHVLDLSSSSFVLRRYLVFCTTAQINDEFRCAFTFFFYFVFSFFGAGNIASLNSFDPTDITCFVSVFNPFLMTALLLIKTFIPLLLISVALHSLSVIYRSPKKRMLTMTLIYSNLMGLYFLFQIKNTGSWLDIGVSLSHFVIMQAMILLNIVLSIIGKILTIPSVQDMFISNEVHLHYS